MNDVLEMREKELRLFTDNYNSIGLQAALLAGFAMTSLAELNVPDDTPKIWKILFFVGVTLTLASEVHCVCNAMFTNLYGPGLALRGPPGSIYRATQGMYDERRQIFIAYWIGLISFQVAAIAGVRIVSTEMNIVTFGCIIILSCSIVATAWYGRRIWDRFKVREGEQTTFEELGAITSGGPTRPARRQVSGGTGMDWAEMG